MDKELISEFAENFKPGTSPILGSHGFAGQRLRNGQKTGRGPIKSGKPCSTPVQIRFANLNSQGVVQPGVFFGSGFINRGNPEKIFRPRHGFATDQSSFQARNGMPQSFVGDKIKSPSLVLSVARTSSVAVPSGRTRNASPACHVFNESFWLSR
jgi:hypothetical protein